MTKSAYLGACDWRHSEWLGPFYPDDMPEDWQLAFYYTQFSCVWMSSESWLAVSASERQGWLAEVGASFRLLVESRDIDLDALSREASVLDDGPLLIPDADAVIIWFDKHTDLNDLTQRIKTAIGIEPVYLISRDADLDKLSQVSMLLELLGMQ